MAEWHFYGKKEGNMQKGIYNTFIVKHKIPKQDMVNYLDEYALTIGEELNHINRQTVIIHLQCNNNFDSFCKFISDKTGITFKKRKKKYKPKHNHYQPMHYITEALQYTNGCADDF